MTPGHGYLTDLDLQACTGCGHRRVNHPHGGGSCRALPDAGPRVACSCRGFADGRWHLYLPAGWPDGTATVSGSPAQLLAACAGLPTPNYHVQATITLPDGRSYYCSIGHAADKLTTITTTKETP